MIEKAHMRVVRYCSNPQCATPFDFEHDKCEPSVLCPPCDVKSCVSCNSVWSEGRPYKVDGCNFIKCRCGRGFCLKCGNGYAQDSDNNDGARENRHGIPTCQCLLLDGIPDGELIFANQDIDFRDISVYAPQEAGRLRRRRYRRVRRRGCAAQKQVNIEDDQVVEIEPPPVAKPQDVLVVPGFLMENGPKRSPSPVRRRYGVEYYELRMVVDEID
eukprot:IDg9555t1